MEEIAKAVVIAILTVAIAVIEQDNKGRQHEVRLVITGKFHHSTKSTVFEIYIFWPKYMPDIWWKGWNGGK